MGRLRRHAGQRDPNESLADRQDARAQQRRQYHPSLHMKKAPLSPAQTKSIARWEGEGGAPKSPAEEERDEGEARAETERLRVPEAPRRRAK